MYVEQDKGIMGEFEWGDVIIWLDFYTAAAVFKIDHFVPIGSQLEHGKLVAG